MPRPPRGGSPPLWSGDPGPSAVRVGFALGGRDRYYQPEEVVPEELLRRRRRGGFDPEEWRRLSGRYHPEHMLGYNPRYRRWVFEELAWRISPDNDAYTLRQQFWASTDVDSRRTETTTCCHSGNGQMAPLGCSDATFRTPSNRNLRRSDKRFAKLPYRVRSLYQSRPSS